MPRKNTNAKRAIIDAFNGKDKLIWSTILKSSKVSKGALSQHLNQLIDLGLIKVELEKDKRGRAKTYYILNSNKLHKKYETSLYKEIISGRI